MYRQKFEQYNNSFDLTLINVPLQQTVYQYAAAKLLRELKLTSETLQKWAILDSGTSSHFILSTAKVLNKNIADKPLTVRLPDGRTICSSHKGTLPLTQLPIAARIAYIITGLASHSLMSVVKLCDAGYKVEMKEFLCKIQYNGINIIKCSKYKQLGLWMIPLTYNVSNEVEQETNGNLSSPPVAYSAYKNPTKS